MANAMLRYDRTQKQNLTSDCVVQMDCFFWGADVSEEIDGKTFQLQIVIEEALPLATFKQDIIAAVQAKAAELGITVNGSDINVPSFETGGPA